MNTIVTAENRGVALAGLPLYFKLVCGSLTRIEVGQLTFILPDGRIIRFEGNREPDVKATITINDFAFARRVIFGGDIGFFESFSDEDWTTNDLAQCLYFFARNADYIQGSFRAAPVLNFINNVGHAFNKNTRAGSRRNIMAHYDLGNSFYEKWLDSSMTYSSAWFPDSDADLTAAQLNKYESLANSIGLSDGENVLEIGSGWGGFAEYAAKTRGALVTGLTLSPAQLEYARKRIFEAGLSEKVDFRLQDYRDVNETFDKIVSIEMFEAVGQQYWQTYFDKVRDALKPGGVAGLQIITIADRFFESYLKSTDFIQRYIFPGGMLPSPTILKNHMNEAGLSLQSVNEFGQDYARTLAQWRHDFIAAWDDIRELGFDEKFKKLWRYYLAYCEAGFKAGTTNVCQVTVGRP